VVRVLALSITRLVMRASPPPSSAVAAAHGSGSAELPVRKLRITLPISRPICASSRLGIVPPESVAVTLPARLARSDSMSSPVALSDAVRAQRAR
jgi:hypothetical protein